MTLGDVIGSEVVDPHVEVARLQLTAACLFIFRAGHQFALSRATWAGTSGGHEDVGPGSGDGGDLERVAGAVGRLAGDRFTVVDDRRHFDGAGNRVVVVDRARRGNLSADRKGAPLGGEDEMSKIGGSGDVARAEVPGEAVKLREATRRFAIERVQARGGCDGWPLRARKAATGDGSEIGRPAFEESAVGTPDVGRIGRPLDQFSIGTVVPVDEGVHRRVGENIVLNQVHTRVVVGLIVTPFRPPVPQLPPPAAGGPPSTRSFI